MTRARIKPARTTDAHRKRRVPSEERRRQILSVAAELFAAHGYAGTTTKQLAEAAGVSETIVYRLFATKEELYQAILEERLPRDEREQWLGELRAIADRKADEELFCAVAGGILRAYREDPTSRRLILYAALENHELGSALQLRYILPLLSFLREYVSRRQAEGAFRIVNPDMVAAAAVNFAVQIAQWNAFGLNPSGLTDDDVFAFARTLLAGLRAPFSEPTA